MCRNFMVLFFIGHLFHVGFGVEDGNSTSDSTTRVKNRVVAVEDDTMQAEKNMSGHFSSAYIVQAELGIREMPTEEIPSLEEHFGRIILAAFQLSTMKHLHQEMTGFTLTNRTNNPFTVQILGVNSIHGIVRLDFVVYFEEKLIEAQVIVEDISLLTLSQLSAILQYPVISVKSEFEINKTEESRWWIIAIIIGSGLLIVIFGWILLFIYYNTCGRPLPKYSTRAIDEEKTATSIDQNVQTEVEERENSYDKERSLEKYPHEPYIIVREPVERDVASNVLSKVAAPEVLDSIVSEKTIKSEHANGGSSLLVEHKEADVISISARSRPVTQRPTIRERPKSAIPHKRPMRTIEGDIIEELVPTQKPKLWWSPYMSGDEVAAVYSIGPGLSNHPSPLPASETGVIELSSNDLLRYL